MLDNLYNQIKLVTTSVHNYHDISSFLSDCRNSIGLKQCSAAHFMQIKHDRYNKLERDKFKELNELELSQIAEFYGVKIKYLLKLCFDKIIKKGV